MPQLARALLCAAVLDSLHNDPIGGIVARGFAVGFRTIFDEALSRALPPSAQQLECVATIVPVLITMRARAMHARHAKKHAAANAHAAHHAWIDAFWPEIDLAQAAGAAQAA